MRRRVLTAIFALCACVPAQTPRPVIRVPAQLVPTPTLVFSQDDRLIFGLEAADFRMFDNGRPQKVTLDQSESPLSVAIAVQANVDVRDYLSFITKTGSVFESLLQGATGESAVITYQDEVEVAKPFNSGDLQAAFRGIRAKGLDAHMLDAAWRALELLEQRPPSRARFLILIGQPMDSGSGIKLESVRNKAEAANVQILAITLPEFGKAFVSDNFYLQGVSRGERGGFVAGVNLGALVAALSRSSSAAAGADPFSTLASATGGTQTHVRKQGELEEAISAIGEELRSAYQLSFVPSSDESGYHTIKVEVDVPGAKVFARPGYWRAAE